MGTCSTFGKGFVVWWSLVIPESSQLVGLFPALVSLVCLHYPCFDCLFVTGCAHLSNLRVLVQWLCFCLGVAQDLTRPGPLARRLCYLEMHRQWDKPQGSVF